MRHISRGHLFSLNCIYLADVSFPDRVVCPCFYFGVLLPGHFARVAVI